jgi:hypothetical protein
MSATLASQLLRQLHSAAGARVADEGEAIRCRIRRGSVQVIIVVPTGVLEWSVDATDTESGLAASDWCDYTKFLDTPADELDREMADDVMVFAAQLLIRELRLVARDSSHGQLEWKIDGAWQVAIPLDLDAARGAPPGRGTIAPPSTSRSEADPLYHGYVIVPETCIDGWCLGLISEFEGPEGCTSGDAFVVAPDGRRAELMWEVGTTPLEEILPPDAERWGVYAVSFPHATRTVADLVAAFRAVLPQLRARYAAVKKAQR